MNTHGEIEAAICERISRFEHEYMGRGPKDIHAYLIGDLLVVRLQGVLTAAERQLVEALPAEKGRSLLKDVRTQLNEAARSVLEAIVLEVTGGKAGSMHHDISTITGEEVVLFTLATTPLFRDAKKKYAQAAHSRLTRERAERCARRIPRTRTRLPSRWGGSALACTRRRAGRVVRLPPGAHVFVETQDMTRDSGAGSGRCRP